MSTDIGYRWKPSGQTFTIDGNTYPLTRITSTKVVPLKETTSKLIVLWYLDSGCSKHMTGNRSLLINFVHKFLVPALVAPDPADSIGLPSSNAIDQDAPSPSTSPTPQETLSLVIPSSVEEHFHDIEVAQLDNDPFFGVPIP
nr:hypothetical protein [Tanacetum cinerariifolium]